MIFQSIKTSDLSAGMVNEIFYLKDSHWNFGFKSQKKWFLKNMKPNDLHNILKIDDKIVGYTLLAFRSYKISANHTIFWKCLQNFGANKTEIL